MRRVAVQQGYRVYATLSAYWCTGVLEEGYRPRAECISTRATVGRSGVPGSTRLFLARGTDIHIQPTRYAVTRIKRFQRFPANRSRSLVPLCRGRHCGPSGGRPFVYNLGLLVRGAPSCCVLVPEGRFVETVYCLPLAPSVPLTPLPA